MASKIRVLYDGEGFREPHGGVSRYFSEMIKRLPSGYEPNIAVESTINIYLQEDPFNIPKAKCSFRDFLPAVDFRGKSLAYALASRLMPWVWPSCELKNNRKFHNLLRSGEYDVLHLTGPHKIGNEWKCVLGHKPIVVTVHDLIPEIYGLKRFIPANRGEILKAASQIIAVSENTKKDLINIFNIPKEKISVIYHGITEFSGQVKDSALIGKKYILYVGKRGGYKNSDFFFKAIAPLLRKERSLSVVCTGMSFTKEEQQLLTQERIFDQVHQEFVPDCAMKSLFSNAICFVYPSLYEGFGIPILDAFSAGCPVILSNSSCFPEVAGDAALYFDEGDSKTFQCHVESLLHDSKVRDKMIVKGHERAKFFSWAKCAQKTADVYKKVLSL